MLVVQTRISYRNSDAIDFYKPTAENTAYIKSKFIDTGKMRVEVVFSSDNKIHTRTHKFPSMAALEEFKADPVIQQMRLERIAYLEARGQTEDPLDIVAHEELDF